VTFQNEEVFAFMKSELTAGGQGAPGSRRDREARHLLANRGGRHRRAYRPDGEPQYNQKLSERRAESVKAHLVSKGTDGDKIETLGMGKTVPAKFCPDIKGRSELIACLAPNRRAIVSIKGPGR